MLRNGSFQLNESPAQEGPLRVNRLPSWLERSQSLEVSETERWFAFQMLPFQEARAEFQMFLQDYRTFVPKVEKTVRHARKLRNVQSALFPRYGFVILNLAKDQWRPINSTFGVAALVTGNGKPLPMPKGIVENLISMTDESGLVRFDRQLAIGQRVRMLSGPFANVMGVLQRLDGKGRVRVLLELMNASIPLSTELSMLAPIAP